MLWLIKHTEKFPRHHRYSLGLAMENRLQDILYLLLRAKYTHNKKDFLNEANIQIETLRFQLRLAKDLKALPTRSHGFGSKQLLDIGGQLGGWLKSKVKA